MALKRLAGGVTFCYAALFAIACASHHALLYPSPTPEYLAANTDLYLLGGDEQRSLALCSIPAGATAPVVIFFHGNAEQITNYQQAARSMSARGIGFCAVEYPGYGALHAQRASESAIYLSAIRSLDRIEQELGVSRDRIVLAGWSLGSGVATEMAARQRGARLILLSPYTSLLAVAQRIAMIVPMGMIMDERFDSLAKSRHISIPALVIHGARDQLIPPLMGRGLAASFANGQYVELSQRAHGDVIGVLFSQATAPVEQDFDTAVRVVERFIRRR